MYKIIAAFAVTAFLIAPNFGRAQPIANIPSYSAQFGWNPDTGQWTGLKIVSGGGVAVQNTLPSTSAPFSGSTSTTPGTWTSVLAASSSRNGCAIQNQGTDNIWIVTSDTTPTVPGFKLEPGQAANCSSQQQLWVKSTSASQAFFGKYW